ncbi:pH adaptation potassium efflux protein PhaG [Methyloversatilis universalis FAM5]|uniref:pH adaptation potassium efflux protein PhaG n=1 Tax=Methyloversatilis universalis (strain ATCC BAA-1314 / DSM 25237 / JCM 13912 / CCUG 52030 / FAM5) TaxID=1000565 RepID=F5R9K7_METUF|nr:Na+/H+ antiporter subunit G [Methyloversatilis universalis]EGK73077.1 pH adaptation potassium efflux protein PhaG [Methyloversatilis universalis FAM5]
MIPPLPLWIEIPVALLLALSGLFTLGAAIGVVRFRAFFQRMHPPALAFSFSAWCVTLASILYFSAQDGVLSLHAWLIIIFLSLTVPVTTLLLSRTELFRRRNAGDPDMPPPLSACVQPPDNGGPPQH